MMSSFNTTGIGLGFSALWAVHVLSVIAFFVGVIFLIVWAVKTFPIARLFQWAIWLLVGGAVACLLTIGIMGHPWGGFGNMMVSRGFGGMMGGQNMMYRFDADDDDSFGGMMGGNGGMMSNMGMMLRGLEGDKFDEAFIRLMIPHHEGAIDMAQEALKSAKHPEMKQLANDIIKAQQREIDMMKSWLTQWGYED